MISLTGFTLYWYVTGFSMVFPHIICALLLQKRSKPALRFTIGILVSAVVAYLDLYLPVSMLTFAIMHVAALALLVWCCTLRLGLYLYYFVWGVAFYFLAEQLSAVIATLFEQYNILPVMYVYKLFSIAAVTALEIWMIISIRKKGAEQFNWRLIILSALICGMVITINIVSFSRSGQQGLFIFMFQFFSMVTIVLMLYMLVVTQDRSRRQNEAEFYEYLWRSNLKSFEMKKAYLDMINHKYHDMKHEIRAIRQMGQEERSERLDRLEQMIDGYQNLYQTGNEVLDTILNDKRRECENRKILLTCTANANTLDFIDVVDLNILLGNLFDNAIEAVNSLAEEQKVIDFKIFNDKQFLRIMESNYYEGDIQYDQDRLVSAKGQNGIYHGFGTQSMKHIVSRYHGEMEIETDHHIFRLHILIPCS